MRCEGWTRTNHSFDGFFTGIVVSCFLTPTAACRLLVRRMRSRSNGSGGESGRMGWEVVAAATMESTASAVDTLFVSLFISLQRSVDVQAAVLTGGFLFGNRPAVFTVVRRA